MENSSNKMEDILFGYSSTMVKLWFPAIAENRGKIIKLRHKKSLNLSMNNLTSASPKNGALFWFIIIMMTTQEVVYYMGYDPAEDYEEKFDKDEDDVDMYEPYDDEEDE